MKRTLPIISSLVLLLSPVGATLADVIELKNDSQFVTNQYWEDGNQIKFYYYGGVVGVDKSLVRDISDSHPADQTEDPGIGKAAIPVEPAKTDTKPNSAREKQPAPAPPKEDYLQEKESIESEIRTASEAYREARAQNDPSQKEKRRDLLRLQTRLSQLRGEVKEAYGGKVPDWWNGSE